MKISQINFGSVYKITGNSPRKAAEHVCNILNDKDERREQSKFNLETIQKMVQLFPHEDWFSYREVGWTLEGEAQIFANKNGDIFVLSGVDSRKFDETGTFNVLDGTLNVDYNQERGFINSIKNVRKP